MKRLSIDSWSVITGERPFHVRFIQKPILKPKKLLKKPSHIHSRGAPRPKAEWSSTSNLHGARRGSFWPHYSTNKVLGTKRHETLYTASDYSSSYLRFYSCRSSVWKNDFTYFANCQYWYNGHICFRMFQKNFRMSSLSCKSMEQVGIVHSSCIFQRIFVWSFSLPIVLKSTPLNIYGMSYAKNTFRTAFSHRSMPSKIIFAPR